MNTKKSKLRLAVAIMALSVFATACVNDTQVAEEETPLNITIFLDLSDRITMDHKDGMSQPDKDIALVSHMVKQFKERAQRLKIHHCKDRMQVLFHPTPNDVAIDSYANGMIIDMGALSVAERKPKLIAMDSVWTRALNAIYTKTIADGEFPGSDIWGFFSEDVKYRCIKEGYRNIVIFLTDGYIYYEGANRCEAEGCTWIAGSDNSKQLNTTLLVGQQDLQDLEVMFLELTPHTQRYPILQKTIDTWLHSMGVEKTLIYKTGLPTHITPIIDDFIEW